MLPGIDCVREDRRSPISRSARHKNSTGQVLPGLGGDESNCARAAVLVKAGSDKRLRSAALLLLLLLGASRIATAAAASGRGNRHGAQQQQQESSSSHLIALSARGTNRNRPNAGATSRLTGHILACFLLTFQLHFQFVNPLLVIL